MKLGVPCAKYNRLCYGCQAERRRARIALASAQRGACFVDGFSPWDRWTPERHAECESLLLYGLSVELLTLVGG